jgi:DNA-binding transcriptional LysR family regulator
MELRHLKYFIAVAEELHFGRAAQRLHVSQPPLSQQIQALEREVGVRLFDRTRHKVTLSKAGETMLPEAYRLLEQSERVRNAPREAMAGLTMRLDIGCVSSALSPTLAYESGSVQGQIGFVACGLGIALVPKAVDRWRIPGVVVRELDRSIRTTDLSLVWNGATRNEAVDLLLEVADSVFPRSA